MAPLELLRRLTARVTETYLGRLKSGEMRPADSLALARRAIEAAPLLHIVDATQAYASPVYLREVARIAKGDARHLLIVVDSVHSWAESAPHGAQEYESLNDGLAALRALSHQLTCPVLAVAERNRGSMKEGGLSAGAGTRKIEYGAETVIDLQRDEQAREDGAGEVPVVAKFSKNRNGAAGKSVRLKFNGALQRFQEDA
jgi:replicative DNA helicase